MKRVIKSLSRVSYEIIRDSVPRAIKSESIYEDLQVVDIELSEAVIIKSYDDGIHIDLGAKRVFIDPEDFESIEIG